jgi:hypothetical protein
MRHFIQDRLDLWDDIHTVNEDRSTSRCTKGDMQSSTVLGYIYLFSPKHRVHPRVQSGLVRQLDEKLNRLVGDSIFRVIEVQARRLDCEAFTAVWILCKKVAKMEAPNLPMVAL